MRTEGLLGNVELFCALVKLSSSAAATKYSKSKKFIGITPACKVKRFVSQ